MWLVQFPKSFSWLVLRSKPSLMCWAEQRHLLQGCYVRPFSNSPRHFVTAALSLRHHRTHLSAGSELLGGRSGSPKRTESQYVFLRGAKSFQCYQRTSRTASDCCGICWTMSLIQVLPSTKKWNASITQNFISKSTRWNASCKQTYTSQENVCWFPIYSLIFSFIIPKSVSQFKSETSARWAQKRFNNTKVSK
jgi:hypothetical protein